MKRWLSYRSVKNSQGSRNNFIEKCPTLQESTAAKDLANEVIELIPLSDDDSKDNIKGVGEFEYIAYESTSSQGEAKPLILLEDVDIIFLEDRGFISAIQEIADTGKGPIILTSNSKSAYSWMELFHSEGVLQFTLMNTCFYP